MNEKIVAKVLKNASQIIAGGKLKSDFGVYDPYGNPVNDPFHVPPHVMNHIHDRGRSQKGESDYIYDPEHKNRPHNGGTWYKTPKGWSTNPQEKKKVEAPKNFKYKNEDNQYLSNRLKDPNLTKEVYESLLDDGRLYYTLGNHPDKEDWRVYQEYFDHPFMTPDRIEQEFNQYLDETDGDDLSEDDWLDFWSKQSKTPKKVKDKIKEIKKNNR